MEPAYLGIDFGTSGARAIVIDADRQIQAQTSIKFAASIAAADLAESWRTTLFQLIAQLPAELRSQLQSIAINGTSSTVLICDCQGQPIAPPLLYNDARGATALDQVKAIAPPNHTVVSATSSLAKLLWLAEEREQGTGRREQEEDSRSRNLSTYPAPHFLHQADWLSFLLHGKLGISDYHNALKLGYDVGELRYPGWLQRASIPFQLPMVVAPGTPIAPVQVDLSERFGLPTDCMVCAGTTDSIAAFLASGAASPGEAVTSLGSTLVLKLLSEARVDDSHYGIYSHRLGNLWLVGGASNTGGAVLQQFFTAQELQSLSQQIQPDRPSPFNYYPLPKPGERFPINDPALSPRLEPRPNNPVEFLHGLLESIARIEAEGYQRLQQLGATALTQVYTAGGGAKNAAWTMIRSRHLHVPVLPSAQTEAAYGTALLARKGREEQGTMREEKM
jgi:sugar (pentulose or hexulose) kinase